MHLHMHKFTHIKVAKVCMGYSSQFYYTLAIGFTLQLGQLENIEKWKTEIAQNEPNYGMLASSLVRIYEQR